MAVCVQQICRDKLAPEPEEICQRQARLCGSAWHPGKTRFREPRNRPPSADWHGALFKRYCADRLASGEDGKGGIPLNRDAGIPRDAKECAGAFGTKLNVIGTVRV
jgi:hypothetical protein